MRIVNAGQRAVRDPPTEVPNTLFQQGKQGPLDQVAVGSGGIDRVERINAMANQGPRQLSQRAQGQY